MRRFDTQGRRRAAFGGSGDAGLGKLVDRTLFPGFEEVDPPGWIRRVAPGLGGIVLYGQNLRTDADAARLARVLRDEGDVLMAVDEEGGDVTRLHYHSGSPTPGNQVLGAVDDAAATATIAGSIGAELRASGILLDLAPVVDVNADPDNPVIGVRSFGADSDLVARHTAAWVAGLQAQGVAGCAKHFPGHGDTRTDSHLALPTVSCGREEWWRVHAPPFVAAIGAGVQSIMTAHIRYPALDGSAYPATMNRHILVDLLRHELGFEGVVMTDALEMAAIAARYGPAEGAVAALVAGADALCLGGRGGEATYRRVRDAIVDAVHSGRLPRRRLEAAAGRVQRLREWTLDPAAGRVRRPHAGRPDPAAGCRPVPGAPATPDGLGVDLVRRAAQVHGLRPLTGPPVIVELRATPNLAVGAAAWDLAAPLRKLGYPPSSILGVSGPGADLDAALVEAAGQPLVVVGRDVVRHGWQHAAWQAVRAARPDAVLVDVGLPRPADLGDGPYVLVGGAARPNLQVAAEAIVQYELRGGRHWTPPSAA